MASLSSHVLPFPDRETPGFHCLQQRDLCDGGPECTQPLPSSPDYGGVCQVSPPWGSSFPKS